MKKASKKNEGNKVNTLLPADAVKLKLTPKQNAVIFCLQNGWELITDMEMCGAIVANNTMEYRINNGLFFRLINMDLIYQGGSETRHSFTLTPLGKKCITKQVSFNITK